MCTLVLLGALDALDRAVKLRGARREQKLAQSVLLAGVLELGGELRHAVDLQTGRGKGHAVQQGNRAR